MIWLPAGCARPETAELDAYWQRACSETHRDNLPADASYQVRWIGLDHGTTEEVIELIIAGDKTGTFSLPWLIDRTGQPMPAVGDRIILIDFAGHPRLLVQLTELSDFEFGTVTPADTAIDGSPVRDLNVWIPLHTHYWNKILAPFDLQVDDTMPVITEKFKLLHVND